MITAFLWFMAVVLVITGFIGTIVPILPGAPLVFFGLLLGAFIDGFQNVGWVTLTILGLLTALVLAIDIIATTLGAKKVGASRLALVGAAIGTIVGIFFALPGIIFGPFIGAMVGEYLGHQDLFRAGKVGFGTWLGLLVGTAFKLAILFAMLGIFITAYFVRF